jgi:hypothetical protein
MAAKIAPAKTVPTKASVKGFLDGVADPTRRADCETLVAMMQKTTGEEPRMWGSSIIGFGDAHCRGSSGRVSHAAMLAFSPRKKDLSIYLLDGVDAHGPELDALGIHACGKGCLYLSTLADVDLKVLGRIFADSVKNVKRMFPVE